MDRAARANSIQVSGQQCFPENEWRNAILYYLFGVWSNRDQVIYRPKMSFEGPDFFGGVSLRLSIGERRYFAFAGPNLASEFPMFNDDEVLTVSSGQTEVEVGLVRFAKDDSIRMLVISFGEGKKFALWKHQRRGQLSFAGENLELISE